MQLIQHKTLEQFSITNSDFNRDMMEDCRAIRKKWIIVSLLVSMY